MTIYWLIYLIPVSFALSHRRYNEQAKTFLLSMFGIFLIFTIGLRERVGGDWTTYIKQFRGLSDMDFIYLLFASDKGYVSDKGYAALNLFSSQDLLWWNSCYGLCVGEGNGKWPF